MTSCDYYTNTMMDGLFAFVWTGLNKVSFPGLACLRDPSSQDLLKADLDQVLLSTPMVSFLEVLLSDP